MRRITGTVLGLVLAAAMVGCGEDRLVVENVNSPDRDRALARPLDVENLAAGQFRIINQAWWNVTSLQAQVAVMGTESFSTNANFGMGVRSGIPRSLIDNSRGNPADFYGSWLSLNQAARAVAVALNRFSQTTFSFVPTSEAQRQRDRAWCYFVLGLAQGYVALAFDSGSVITPDDDLEALNLFVGYDSLMRAALTDLDSAIAIASLATPTGANGFPIPSTATSWIRGVSLTGGATGDFARLARSYKARFRAAVARTPTERAAVDWAAVISEASNGITANFHVSFHTSDGPFSYRPMQMDLYQSWHQMWQIMMGMADTSGAYDTWLNTSRALKVPFVVQTPDRRFPAGATRAAQNTASGCSGSGCLQPDVTNPVSYRLPYFRNRLAGEDVAVDGLFHSYYDFYRFQPFFNAARQCTAALTCVPQFTVMELNLLRAEGYIRTGDFTNAMAMINLSRTRANGPNLPALSGITSINDPIPDVAGARCVPRVPVGATNANNFTPTATACGNIMEAMKYEKRLETAFIFPGSWFFDGRGWGDIPVGTPLHFPVPYTELDARRQLIYSVPTTNPAAGIYTAAERLSNSASNYGLGQ